MQFCCFGCSIYDRFHDACVQMIHHLAIRIKAFHAHGLVHRDIKPGFVMWLPRQNRWTIIDFGCVARTGQQTKLRYTLGYAAPEVIAACCRGDMTMVVEVCFAHTFCMFLRQGRSVWSGQGKCQSRSAYMQEALDVWSLGVMAFELLTGQPAIVKGVGKEQACFYTLTCAVGLA